MMKILSLLPQCEWQRHDQKKFNIAPMVMETQMQRMGVNPLLFALTFVLLLIKC